MLSAVFHLTDNGNCGKVRVSDFADRWVYVSRARDEVVRSVGGIAYVFFEEFELVLFTGLGHDLEPEVIKLTITGEVGLFLCHSFKAKAGAIVPQSFWFIWGFGVFHNCAETNC